MSTKRASAPRPSTAAEAVADRLHSAAIHLLRAVRRQDDRSGLSAPRLSALSVVVFAGPLTLGELAAAEQVKPPTMTRLVTALEAKGLVVREGDSSDARRTQVRATAKGQTMLARARALRIEALALGLADVDGADQAALIRAADLIERIVPKIR
jgi:DNA-binding MarR family transcriptional regulator